MISATIDDLARTVIEYQKLEELKIVTAESCTGGLLAAALTEIPGASAVFERGFITYSNEAKTEVLGVPAELIEQYGAVSGEVAEAMATGALEFSHADRAIAVTGIAGPDGGSAQKPVGLVYIGFASRDGALFHVRNQFYGNREAIRLAAVQEALTLLLPDKD